jgi:hypothetical protein
VTTQTQDWVITFTFDADPPIETMDEWEDGLADLDGSVARIPGRGVDVTVYAPGALEMPEAVNKVIGEVQHVLHMSAPVGLEIVTEAEWRHRAQATLPELMSAAEVADELGVSRQRVHQLRGSAGFPAPLADLRGGAVWDAAAIRRFDKGWHRRPGRPRTHSREGAD